MTSLGQVFHLSFRAAGDVRPKAGRGVELVGDQALKSLPQLSVVRLPGELGPTDLNVADRAIDAVQLIAASRLGIRELPHAPPNVPRLHPRR